MMSNLHSQPEPFALSPFANVREQRAKRLNPWMALGSALLRLLLALRLPRTPVSASVPPDALSDLAVPISSLSQQLNSLQAHVATLEHQLALLTQQLQKELQWRS